MVTEWDHGEMLRGMQVLLLAASSFAILTVMMKFQLSIILSFKYIDRSTCVEAHQMVLSNKSFYYMWKKNLSEFLKNVIIVRVVSKPEKRGSPREQREEVKSCNFISGWTQDAPEEASSFPHQPGSSSYESRNCPLLPQPFGTGILSLVTERIPPATEILPVTQF